MTHNLDIEHSDKLTAYLRDKGWIDQDEQPAIRILDGGVSNRTIWLERSNGEAWVLKQALEKLRVPADWFSHPDRVHREALGLRWLAHLAPPGTVPRFIFEDLTHHVIAMTAVPQPHENWKRLLLSGQLVFDHIAQFARLLGIIHRRASEQRIQVEPVFADRSFFESLRLEPYYQYTAGQVTQAANFLHALIEETRATRLTLVHGDYSPKNVLVHQNRLVLLDFEVIHFGDPAFDIGFSMTHLLSKAHHMPARRADFADAALYYWNTYRTTLEIMPWAKNLEERAVRHTLACLLSRVAGKSPLEYLSSEEKARQQAVVLKIMAGPPDIFPDLVAQFLKGLQ
jgi:fructosamine-3-kinase